MIQLTRDPIDYSAIVESLRNASSGAVVLFLGTVREMSEGKAVDSLEYEAYPAMAEKQLAEVVATAAAKWPIQRSAVVHRYGHLQLGDIAVAVAVATAHRAEAFESARWIMDTIKVVVPIWKREHWADGRASWVHPDVQPAANEGAGESRE